MNLFKELRRIEYAIALGIFINVAVAWYCALAIDLSTQRLRANFVQNDGRHTSIFKSSKSGAHRVWVVRQHVEDQRAWRWKDNDEIFLPEWSFVRSQSDAFRTKEIPMEMRWENSRGWPMLSLSVYGSSETTFENSVIEFGVPIDVAFLRERNGRLPRLLPLKPIWEGFWINSFFFAFCVYVLMTLWFGGRALRRLYKGRCLKCGHKLVVSQATCPECGRQVSTVRRAAPRKRNPPRAIG